MSTGLVLLDAWIAGIFYYDARGVAPQLGEGSPLALRREPGNPHDGNAVEILTEAGIKLGYVPRRMNAGIAHRLDAGFDLRCCVVSVDQDGDGLGIRFTIRSLTPGDTPDPAPPPSLPRSPPRMVGPPYQINALGNALSNARRAFSKGERFTGYQQLDTALNWALDLWALRHPEQLERGSGWVQLFGNFMQGWTDPLPRRLWLVTLVLGALADPAPSTDTLVTENEWQQILRSQLAAWQRRLAGDPELDRGAGRDRLDWAFLSEVEAVTAILSDDPAVDAPPPRAERLPAARREQVLRCLFRWFRLMDDHERIGIIPISRMMAVRALNWDAALAIELQVRELRQALDTLPRTVAEEVRRREDERKWPALFPTPPVPYAELRCLLERTIDLMQTEPRPAAELCALAEHLRGLQPQSRRRNRRRVRSATDNDLYLAECFARNAAAPRPDLYVAIRLLTVCVPYRHLDRLRLHDLERIAEVLSRRYFGVSHQMLRNALPPPAFAQSCSPPVSLWLWRDNGPIVPVWATPDLLASSWADFIRWATGTQVAWSDLLNRESYRQGLHLRTQVREQVLLSPRRIAQRISLVLDAADFDFLASAQPSPHVWGAAWEQAYGHRPATHWWYYRVPVGFQVEIVALA